MFLRIFVASCEQELFETSEGTSVLISLLLFLGGSIERVATRDMRSVGRFFRHLAEYAEGSSLKEGLCVDCGERRAFGCGGRAWRAMSHTQSLYSGA